MRVTRRWIARHYAIANLKYFNSALPRVTPRDIDFEVDDGNWEDCEHHELTGGNPKLHFDKATLAINDFARICLLHAMIHISLPASSGHGQDFWQRQRRLMRSGAYDELL